MLLMSWLRLFVNSLMYTTAWCYIVFFRVKPVAWMFDRCWGTVENDLEPEQPARTEPIINRIEQSINNFSPEEILLIPGRAFPRKVKAYGPRPE